MKYELRVKFVIRYIRRGQSEILINSGEEE